jgi:response regulator RpfG family c-di-GMP phosphodiesterase
MMTSPLAPPEIDLKSAPAAILAVDDEPAILSALSRLLRPDGIRVVTALGGAQALSILEDQAPTIGAIISDYTMPGITGAELLRTVRMRWPDITRVMLTGNADLPAAAQAVNEGQLSRLFTKPWQPDEFRSAVAQALEQNRVLLENRRLRVLADEQAFQLEQWNRELEQTVAERTSELEQANARLHAGLLETVRSLLILVERRIPERANRSREIARLGARLAERAGLSAEESRWIQLAALVHDIGLVALPDLIVRTPPAQLPAAVRGKYEQHPIIGQTMLQATSEQLDLGKWIRHHHERWDGRGFPDGLAGAHIPLPSRIIALADGYLEAVCRDGGTAALWRRGQLSSGAFDPELLRRLDDEIRGRPAACPE